ncbi:MAG TPA: YhjD/YihY/BrkB family envelope integrity protein [Actinomycetota bacterium]|nr:YhjD/YihY/BrkB family envelope integrity protein [Actinomycetota bacterium]
MGLLERIPGARSTPVRLAIAVNARASEDSLGVLAGNLTYTAFLSLFPLLLLGLSVLGFVLAGDPALRADWTSRLTGTIPGLSGLVGRNIEAIVDGRVGTGIIGLAGAAWSASALTGSAEHALSTVFRTPRAGLIRRRLRALLLMLGLGVLAAGSTLLTGLATSWSGGGGLGGAVRALGAIAGISLDLGTFLVAYRALTPRGGPPMRAHVPGAVLMSATWTALKLAGGWYGLRVVARATALYGTVGAVFGLLAILSIAVRSFLYGAELSAVLADRKRELSPAHTPG